MKTLISMLVGVAVWVAGVPGGAHAKAGVHGSALSDRVVKQLKALKLSKPKVQSIDAAVKN